MRLYVGPAAGLIAASLFATAACSSPKPQGDTANVAVPAATPSSSDRSSAPGPDEVNVSDAAAASAPSAQDGWSGRYHYAFSDGANAAGTGVTVTYTLVLTPSSCRFTAEGYQTDETILCSTKAAASGLDVAFKSYDDGKTTDKYGNAVYSVGDPLFSLERSGGKLLTHWKGYPLPDEKPHPKGVYFTR